MSDEPKNKTNAALQVYLADPIVQQAMGMLPEKGRSMLEALIGDAFMRGAKYAVDRCKAEGHSRDHGQ